MGDDNEKPFSELLLECRKLVADLSLGCYHGTTGRTIINTDEIEALRILLNHEKMKRLDEL